MWESEVVDACGGVKKDTCLDTFCKEVSNFPKLSVPDVDANDDDIPNKLLCHNICTETDRIESWTHRVSWVGN